MKDLNLNLKNTCLKVKIQQENMMDMSHNINILERC